MYNIIHNATASSPADAFRARSGALGRARGRRVAHRVGPAVADRLGIRLSLTRR